MRYTHYAHSVFSTRYVIYMLIFSCTVQTAISMLLMTNNVNIRNFIIFYCKTVRGVKKLVRLSPTPLYIILSMQRVCVFQYGILRKYKNIFILLHIGQYEDDSRLCLFYVNTLACRKKAS